MLDIYYQVAVDSVGQPYIVAEQYLITQGPAIAPFLQQKMKESIGLQRLTTEVILEFIAGNESFKASLDYFEKVGLRAAATPMGVPPPESVAEYLFRHFDDSVSSLLGVYSIKLNSIWPSWKTLGAILYLGKLSSSASADTLIRFVSTTADEHYRKIAVQSLVAIGDVKILDKLEDELKPITEARDALRQAADQIQMKLKVQQY